VASAAVGLVVLGAVVAHSVTESDVVAAACYVGVLVGASVGAWIGALRAPRGRRLVPSLIATGVSLTALADALWSVLDLRGEATDVSIADPPWFASYLVLCVALWVVLGRSRGPRGSHVDVDFVIDAVSILVVSVLIIWSISVDTIVADHTVTPFVRTVWAAYPIMDAVLLALVVRVLMSRSARAAIGRSFAVGVCLWLAADIAYLVAPQSGDALVLMDAAWMIAPVLMARAAWRYHDVQAEASSSRTVGGWVGQLTVAVGALMVPALLEIIADLRGEPDQPFELLIGTAVLVTLAFVRTARLLRSEERSRLALESARDAALDASRAKSMFLANMSHEIRTPLTTVLASREILEDMTHGQVELELLAKMDRSGVLLKTLVEGILDFSRIEAGQLELASTEFDLPGMVADIADVYVPRAIEAGIGFDWHVDPRLPQRVVGDPGRVFQVLTNILDNALKFTHQGQVALAVRPSEPAGADADAGSSAGVDFIVEDSGIGIRKEDWESVFESFTQIDGSMTRHYGGSGLGLAICKELTELMGGSIAVQSQLGVGSTFVIHIPLSRRVEVPVDPSSLLSSRGTAPSSERSTLSSSREA